MKAINLIEGDVSVLDRSDIDTDQIIPKQFLKRVERTGFGEFLFYDWAKEDGWDLPANPILATGRNFGSGSSREHAPWALEDYGFQAIVAPSFADIFYSNCTKIGLLPVPLDEDEVRAVMAAGHARIDLDAQRVSWDGGEAAFEIDPETKRRLLEGLDDIGVTLQQARRDRPLRGRPRARRAGHDVAGMTRDWDAGTYDRVSTPQAAWAEAVLERLPLRGDETVLDAGCGSGRVTAMLLERLPDGHVVAVDAAPSMVEHARAALPATAPRCSAPASRSWSWTNRSTRSSPTRSSTGLPTTTCCSGACTMRSSRAADSSRSAEARATSRPSWASRRRSPPRRLTRSICAASAARTTSSRRRTPRRACAPPRSTRSSAGSRGVDRA